MPKKSTEALHKITVDLYYADVEFIKQYGLPITETVRDAVHDKIIMLRAAKQRMTLGDLNAR